MPSEKSFGKRRSAVVLVEAEQPKNGRNQRVSIRDEADDEPVGVIDREQQCREPAGHTAEHTAVQASYAHDEQGKQIVRCGRPLEGLEDSPSETP